MNAAELTLTYSPDIQTYHQLVSDVSSYVRENEHTAKMLDDKIFELWIRTSAWVGERYQDYEPLLLTHPFLFQDYPEIQELGAKAAANTIISAYGKGYTIPTADWQKALEQIKLNKFHLSLATLRPKNLPIPFGERVGLGKILDYEKYFEDQRVIIVGTGGMLYENGMLELGRLAKNPQYDGFPGSTLALIHARDWLTNKYFLMEAAHTLTASIRVEEAHDEKSTTIPSNLRSQELMINDVGAKMMGVHHAWSVHKRAPMLEVVRPRSFKNWKEINNRIALYLPESLDTDTKDYFFQLTQHQFGVPLTFNYVRINEYFPYSSGARTFKRFDAHTMIEFGNKERVHNNDNLVELESGLAKEESEAQMMIIKIAIDNERGAATIAALQEKGYTIVVFEPAIDAWYFDIREGKIKHYTQPPQVWLEKYTGNLPASIVPIYLTESMDQRLKSHFEHRDRLVREKAV